jgi:hypothetical protein
MDPKSINIESVSKEQLLIYMAEKNKEVATTERKLKKVEERYMTIFKENKNLKRLVDHFYNSFRHFIEGASMHMPADEVDKLASFETACSNVSAKIEAMTRDFSSKEVSWEKALAQEKERNSTGMLSEVNRLKQQLYSKEDQIRELQERVSEMETANFDSLLSDLKNISVKKENNIDERIKESDKTNEILRLKHEIKVLKDSLSDKEPSIHRTHSLRENGHFEQHKSAQKYEKGSQAEDAHSNQKERSFPNSSAKYCENSPTGQQSEDQVTVNSSEQNLRQYVKDLLTKYFIYESQSQENEKLLIMNVIFDVLRFSYEEKMKVERTITRRGKFLGLFKT